MPHTYSRGKSLRVRNTKTKDSPKQQKPRRDKYHHRYVEQEGYHLANVRFVKPA